MIAFDVRVWTYTQPPLSIIVIKALKRTSIWKTADIRIFVKKTFPANKIKMKTVSEDDSEEVCEVERIIGKRIAYGAVRICKYCARVCFFFPQFDLLSIVIFFVLIAN